MPFPEQTDIWQEYDCPTCKCDFDIWDEHMACAGHRVECIFCRTEHSAESAITQTMLQHPDQDIEFRDLPRDEHQKAAWIEEVRQANANR